MVHRIGFLLLPDYQLLDVAGPMTVFETANRGYKVELISASGGVIRSSGGADLQTRPLADCSPCQTLLVCGGVGAVAAEIDSAAVDLLNLHMSRGQRVASVCTGAFVLAQADCLKGKRATTHWRYAGELARRYPDVSVEADRIWIRDGAVWTSAGVSAGMDLAMAMVAEDQGSSIARQIAKELVIYYRRPGRQSQFSALLETVDTGGRFAELLTWIRENIGVAHSVESLAARTAMSPRHFSRAFRAETGVTPARAVEQMRLEIAREWVERRTHSLTHVARATGYGSADRMRNSFLRNLGVPPQSIRRSF